MGRFAAGGWAAVALWCLLVAPALAGASEGLIRSYGVGLGGGASEQIAAVVVPVQFELGLRLPELVDAPLSSVSIRAEWIFKVWAGAIIGQDDTVEGGVNPIGLRIAWDAGQSLVPFIDFSGGLMGSGLRKARIGGAFQFNESFGGGLQWFLDSGTAVSLSYQYRHMSNSRIYEQNVGLDTHFALFGIHWFPHRVAK